MESVKQEPTDDEQSIFARGTVEAKYQALKTYRTRTGTSLDEAKKAFGVVGPIFQLIFKHNLKRKS